MCSGPWSLLSESNQYLLISAVKSAFKLNTAIRSGGLLRIKSAVIAFILRRHEAKIYKENPGKKPRQTFMRLPRSTHHLFRGLMLAQTLFNVPKDEQLYPSALITALLPGWLEHTSCCLYGAYAYLGYIITEV